MSKWYCEVLGQVLGPVEFGELVELVRQGTVTASDRVRRVGASADHWEPAESVVGLFRAARAERRVQTAVQSAIADPRGPEQETPLPAGAAAADKLLAKHRALAGGAPSAKDQSEETSASQPRAPARRPFAIATYGQIAVCLLITGFAIYGVDRWYGREALRFPRSQSQRAVDTGYRFCAWESLTPVEWSLLWFDSLALGGCATYGIGHWLAGRIAHSTTAGLS